MLDNRLVKAKRLLECIKLANESIENGDYINKLGYACYCTKEQWDFLQNKEKFKQLCIANRLPVVEQFVINEHNIINSVPSTAFPVITKPSDGSGSSGFSVCHDSLELIEAYNKAKNASPSGNVICERYVKNEALVVFYSISNGNVIYTLAEDKFPVRYEKHGSYVAGLFLCESKCASEFREKYEARIIEMLNSIGLKEGTIWIEIFKDKDDFFFNEVGYRHGGSYSFYTVDYMSGINQIYADLYYSLTGVSKLYGFKSLVPSHVPKGKNYCIYPIHINPGRIEKITGIEKVMSYKNTVFFPISKNIGDVIHDTGSWAQCVALLHFTYDDIEECISVINNVHIDFEVHDSNGTNLVVKKIDLLGCL